MVCNNQIFTVVFKIFREQELESRSDSISDPESKPIFVQDVAGSPVTEVRLSVASNPWLPHDWQIAVNHFHCWSLGECLSIDTISMNSNHKNKQYLRSVTIFCCFSCILALKFCACGGQNIRNSAQGNLAPPRDPVKKLQIWEINLARWR